MNFISTRVKPFEQFSTDQYDQWGDKIDWKGKLPNAKKSHMRTSEEYVFFLSDFTFWGSANNSVLATENGISLKYADDLDPLFIAWKEIDCVKALEKSAIMVLSAGKVYKFRMFQNGIKEDFVTLFNELIHEEVSSFQTEVSALDHLIEKSKRGEATIDEINAAIASCDRLLEVSLTRLEKEFNKREECEIFKRDYHGVVVKRAYLLNQSGKTTQAITDLQVFLDGSLHHPNACVDNVDFDACMLLSDLFGKQKEWDDAAVFLGLAASTEYPDNQRKAKEALQKVRVEKLAYLPVAAREKRAMILCVEDPPTWPVREFCFADAEMLRSSGWTFEMGHPQAGELYVCHPLRPGCYYEVQSFHDKLFDEKRSELVYLLESVGASHVHVEAMTGSSTTAQQDGAVSGNATDALVSGASTEFKHEKHDDSTHNRSQFGIEDRELNPALNPHIPGDLVWYPFEPSWQRIAKAALEKRYKTLSVELHYEEDFAVNQKRMTQVKANLKVFGEGIDIGWNTETESRLQQKKMTTWKYTATFESDTGSGQKTLAAEADDAEVEYLEDLQGALADGPLGESARRILERRRSKLGISTERALALEQSLVQTQLTDDEKEYLEDLKDCFEDGVISDTERRMISRSRTRLGLSEERALELEKMLVAGKKGAS